MNNEQSYFKDDEEEKLLASMSEEEFFNYMECLEVAINERKEVNDYE